MTSRTSLPKREDYVSEEAWLGDYELRRQRAISGIARKVQNMISPKVRKVLDQKNK